VLIEDLRAVGIEDLRAVREKQFKGQPEGE
jgi:hypothetical protein